MRHMKVEHIPLPILARLGQTELPMDAYLGLQIGDIILLDQAVNKPLPIIVGEKEALKGSAGLFENHKAVRMTKND